MRPNAPEEEDDLAAEEENKNINEVRLCSLMIYPTQGHGVFLGV